MAVLPRFLPTALAVRLPPVSSPPPLPAPVASTVDLEALVSTFFALVTLSRRSRSFNALVWFEEQTGRPC